MLARLLERAAGGCIGRSVSRRRDERDRNGQHDDDHGGRGQEDPPDDRGARAWTRHAGRPSVAVAAGGVRLPELVLVWHGLITARVERELDVGKPRSSHMDLA